MKSLFLALSVLVMSQGAFASKLELASCADVGANLESLLLGSENQKSFYNGNVGLVVYDTIEPAAASYGIAIVHSEPVENPEGFITRKCLAVPYLSGVNLKGAKSSYNAKTGVTIVVPVRKMDGITGDYRDAKISINIRTVKLEQWQKAMLFQLKKSNPPLIAATCASMQIASVAFGLSG